ncbi:GH92 family glycosyl hydrolase [Cellulomonas sp. PhB143]|uniref:GH92 family glycosyl hydrolase n=1 Tax=Cellulomonas sp. PhB143 TaxID=2485186 RepID=UPI000FA3D286|nr:GH92 family glycosyl hydrolase [Cellulomonas sp. PhB143]ROS75426.1 putative alpha-1,2-mannosidase [Cellulomonas sp. PhB143]
MLVSAVVVPLAAPASAAEAAAPSDYTQYVNPFIGTDGDHGQDGPGAFAPYGLATVTPTTTPGNHVGYEYTASDLQGFTNLALDGVGGGGGAGDVLVVPTYQSYTARPSTSSYGKTIRTSGGAKDESATAGYYQVGLDESGKDIDAQVTAATRTGVHDYTFGSAGHAALVVDLQHTGNGRKATDLEVGTSPDGNTTLSGSFTGYFYRSSYKLYYYAETTAPASSVQTWGAGGLSSTATTQDGTDIGAVLNFDAAADEHVGLRVTLSPISTRQARRDAAVEVGGKSFDQVRAATKAEWNDRLGKVDVDATTTNDPTGDLKTQLYSHLYRLADSPMNATSTDGTYRGADGAVYRADGYTHYDSWSLWDDFHKYAAVASVYPDVYRDVVQSLVDLYAEVTTSGKGSVASLLQSVPTVRWERAPVVVADAVSKGVRLQGLEKAYPALVAQTGSPASLTNLDSVDGGLLGYSYDAYGLSVIAGAIGKKGEAVHYRDEAARWAKDFDADALKDDPHATAATGVAAGVDDVGMLMPRSSNSDTASFTTKDPENYPNSGLYQGTPWQYNWYDAQDLGGMVDLMGGQENAAKAVNFFFGNQAPDDCSRNLHLYANEISVHAPFLFNVVGQPAQTQDWTYRTVTEPVCVRYKADGNGETSPAKRSVFQNAPDGMLETMDNDAGTMSGYFVSSAIGLYPVMAGGDSFQITTPIFDRTTIHYPGGKDLAVEAPGVSAENHYIQDATLDGRPLNRTWLTAAEMNAGGVLHFTMGSSPSSWGADGIDADSVNDHVSSALYHPSDDVATSTQVFDEAAANDGSIDDPVSVSVTGATVAGAVGSDLTSQVTATGVPEGLALEATKTGASTLDLTLAGRAERHLVDDSTDDLEVTLGAGAFSGSAPSADDRALALKVRFAGYDITPSTTDVTAGSDGAVRSTVDLTLSGGVTFAGATGSVLGASAVAFPGLDPGVTAQVKTTGPTTAAVTFQGTLESTSRTHFTLRLADAALAGATAAQVTGAGTTALVPFVLSPASTSRADLQALYDDARLVTADHYSAASFAVLESAVEAAQAVLADVASSEYELSTALAVLQAASDGLEIGGDGYRRLEAEDHDQWSGGTLKTESGGSGTDVGGVAPGSWLAYRGLDFSRSTLASFVIDYAHNPGTASASSAVEIRTGSPTGPLVTTISLPTTGGWSSYTALTHDFTADEVAALAGSNDVYLVFTGRLAAGQSWVANVDWVQFQAEADTAETSKTVQFESIRTGYGMLNAAGSGLVPGTDYSGADLKTEAGSVGGQLAGTKDGAWVRYRDVDLGSRDATSLSVRYDAPTTKVVDGRLAVHVDSRSGDPLVVVPLPSTGSGWGTYGTTTVALPAELTGRHTIYVDLQSTPTASQPYVGNLDWFALGYAVDKTALRAAIAEYSDRTSDGDLYLATDFAVFTRAFSAAQAVAADPSATAERVSTALRRLTLSADQLRWKVVKQVEVTAVSRCVGANAYVAVRASNGGSTPVDVVLSTPFGTKTVAGVKPGTSAYQSFNTRTGTLEGGTATVTVTASSVGTGTQQATYAPAGC